MKNIAELRPPIETLRERAIFVSSPSPISAEQLDTAARRMGANTFGGFMTPEPDEQVAHITRVAGTLNDKVILDAGCSSGLMVLYAALGNPEIHGKPQLVIGVDHDQKSLRYARRLARQFRSQRSFEGTPVYFSESWFDHLAEIPSASVDVVHESTYLDEAHPTRVYRELLRVVADNGILSLSRYTDETQGIIDRITNRSGIRVVRIPGHYGYQVYKVHKTPTQDPSSL